MKKTVFLFLSVIIFMFISCDDELNIQRDNSAIVTNDLPKYEFGIIGIKVHNHIPEVALKELEEQDGVPLTRAIDRDSIWDDHFGRTIFASSDETVLLPNHSKWAYPGSLLKGNSIEEMKWSPLYAQVKPITISVSFPTSSDVVSREIQPTLSNTRLFINEALNEKIGGQVASSSFSIENFTSYNELRTVFGSNIKTGALFWKKKKEAYEENFKISKRTGLYIKYIQRNFTVDMDIPKSGSLTEGTIEGEQYSPIYINSVTYGRIGILSIETDELSDYAYSTFNEVSKKVFIKKQTTLTNEELRVLNTAVMTLYLLAPGGSTEVYSINGANQLVSLLQMNSEFTKESPGVPIYCSYAYLSDNSPVEVKFRYDITSDPLYVRMSNKSPSDYHDEGLYKDVLLSFYRDREAKMPTVPPIYIKFNLRIKSSRIQYNWDDPVKAWGSITKDADIISFTQNNFKESQMVVYKNFPYRIGKWILKFDPFESNFFRQIKKADVDSKASYIILEDGIFYQTLTPDISRSNDLTNGRGDLNEMVNMNRFNWGNRPD